MTTKQKTLTTFILSAIFLTSVGVYQQASADTPHSESLVATFVDTPPAPGPGEHPYTDVSRSQPVTEMWVFDDSLDGGYFDAVEPAFQEFGLPSEPTPDFMVTYYFPGPGSLPPLSFVKGYEEAHFTFDGLKADKLYAVKVKIDNLADFTTPFGLFEDPGLTIPILETVFVTGNGVELGSVTAVFGGDTGSGPTDQTITKTLEVLAKSNGAGELTVGFNEYFQWDPSDSGTFNAGEAVCTPTKLSPAHPDNPNCKGTQSGIRVAEISLVPGQLVIKKTDVKAKNDIPKAKHDIDVKIDVQGPIATDGSDGAFGYGILTSDGTNVVALTTHMGIEDHPLQTGKFDPIWHAHVLDLALPTHNTGTLGDTCPVNAEFVVDFASSISSGNNIGALYDVKVKGKNMEKIEVKKIPVADVADAGVETIVSFTIITDGTDDPATVGIGTDPDPLPFLCIDIP